MLVRYSRRKAALTLGGAVVVCALCIGVAIAGDEPGIRVAATMLGALAGFAGFRSLQRMTRREPVLLLDDDGLIDHRSKASLIPWSEIEDVGVTRVRGQSFVSLHLRHPDVFLAKYSEPAKLLGRVEGAMGLGDIQISCANLDYSADEIAAESLLHLIR